MMIHGEHKMNCKSLMSLLAFPVPPGDEVTIECEGETRNRIWNGSRILSRIWSRTAELRFG